MNDANIIYNTNTMNLFNDGRFMNFIRVRIHTHIT